MNSRIPGLGGKAGVLITGSAGVSPAGCVTSIIVETRDERFAKRKLNNKTYLQATAPGGRDARAPGKKSALIAKTNALATSTGDLSCHKTRPGGVLLVKYGIRP
jgi:hypothetical protein